jgi:hypothetical protein
MSRVARSSHFLINACVHLFRPQWSAQGRAIFVRVHPFPSPHPPPVALTFFFRLLSFKCRESRAHVLKNAVLGKRRDNACVADHWLMRLIPSSSLVERTDVNDEDFSSVYAANVYDQRPLPNFPLRSSPSTNSVR